MKKDHVLTSMAIEDNIVGGDSYFVAEIMSLKRIFDRVSKGEPTYVFVNEILCGTNTVEIIASPSSVIHWIRNYPSLAFVASHDMELTEILKNQCDNIHFKEEIVGGQGAQFNYKLQGVLLRREILCSYLIKWIFLRI